MRQLKIAQSITNRESRSLEKYLQEINKLVLITPEEEVQLANLIKQGDQQARDALVKANLRFVISVAKQYQNQGCSLPDLIDEGNEGLIKAAQRFDVTKGFKFISYAVWWIRQSIFQAIIANARLVRMPSNKYTQNNQIQKAFQSLSQELEREPCAEEIAELLNMEVEEITLSMSNSYRHISLDAPLSEVDDSSLLDTMVNQSIEKTELELYHNASLRVEVKRSLQMLTERQREVLCAFYSIDRTSSSSLEHIGNGLGLSRERVRQIKDTAIRKLQASSKNERLKSFLGI